MKHSITLLLLIQSLSLMATQFCGQPLTSLQEPVRSSFCEDGFELAMNSSPSFGKTHFIVGRPVHEAEQEPVASTSTATTPSPATQVFFTPDNNVRNELLRYIGQEAEKVQIAVFMMTDQEIAKSLINAVNRNVSVELITDVGCLKERSNKINDLCANGCSVHIYNPSYDKKGRTSLMHHKFALFTNNLGKSLVWTGSYNFTKNASNANQENAIILDDQKIFGIFSKQFRRLKKRSYRYGQRRKSARS